MGARCLPLVLTCLLPACSREAEQAPPPARKSPVVPAAPSGQNTTPQAPAPAGSPFVDLAPATIAIYYTPRAKGDARKAMEAALARGAGYLRVGSLGQKPLPEAPAVLIGEPDVAEWPPPDAESLAYFGIGLSKEQVGAVQDSRQVLVASFAGTGKDRLRVVRDSMALMLRVAEETGGLLWDADTRQLYSLEAWRSRLERFAGDRPVASSIFVIHSYRDGELIRHVTLGLSKLGLPDLAVEQLSLASAEAAMPLINATAQTMLEGGQIREGGLLDIDLSRIQGDWNVVGGARGKGVVHLAVGTRQPGDADNRLWQIVFPGDPGQALQTRQMALLASIFGSDDKVLPVRHDDELEAASRRARARLLEKKPGLAAGLPPLEHLLVKAPFHTGDGGTEWMWIEVLSWKGKILSGLLQSDPRGVRGLRSGDRVETSEDAIFDYIHVRADGSREGNETSAILERR